MSTATPASNVVLDASVALCAAIGQNAEALSWLEAVEAGEVAATWPDLVFVEAGHGLARLARAGRISTADALRGMTRILAAPARVEPAGPLVLPAMHVALERELSVYDALYAVLAEQLQATLVTADVELAAASRDVVLIATTDPCGLDGVPRRR